jgi:hypothetical protein
MRELSEVLRFLEEYWIGNQWRTAIGKLPYPFVRELKPAKLPDGSENPSWWAQLSQINLICHSSFSNAAVAGDATKPSSELVAWQQASPASWLYHVLDPKMVGHGHQRIVGYIHVEPIRKSAGDLLRQGKWHEMHITKDDIIFPDEAAGVEDYIHIGCICVDRPYLRELEKTADRAYRRVALALLMGIVERVMTLAKLNTATGIGPRLVLATDQCAEEPPAPNPGKYQRANGRHHSEALFARYGFRNVNNEKDALGDLVYTFNLGALDPGFLERADESDRIYALDNDERIRLTGLMAGVLSRKGEEQAVPDPAKGSRKVLGSLKGVVMEVLTSPNPPSISAVASGVGMSRQAVYNFLHKPENKGLMDIAIKRGVYTPREDVA